MSKMFYSRKILCLFLFFSFAKAELSTGFIEKAYISNGNNERVIQIYYPASKKINAETKFIIINAVPDPSGGSYDVLTELDSDLNETLKCIIKVPDDFA